MTATLSPANRLADERAALSRVEHDIVDGEQRITEQTIRILALKTEGRGTEIAEQILTTLRSTLAQWYARRAEIITKIHSLEAERAKE